MLSLMSTLVDMAHLPITVSDGVPLDCLILCQNVLDATVWMVETVSNGGHFVMTRCS